MARFQNGWIKLHRKVLDSELMSHPPLFTLWSWILLSANYRESKIRNKDCQETLPIGTVITSIREMADKLQVDRSTVTRWLAYLQRTERIHHVISHSGVNITVLNYDEYQVDQEDDPPQKPPRHQPLPQPLLPHLLKKERIQEEEKYLFAELCLHSAALRELMLEQQVTKSVQKSWVVAYSDVGWIANELFKANAWIEANPRRRPKSFARFAANWLSRNWEKYRTSPAMQSTVDTSNMVTAEEFKKRGTL